MGMPKALVVGDDGVPWPVRAVRALRAGGCDEVVVVLGAGADAARDLIAAGRFDPAAIDVVEAADWADGMGASLRAGLSHLLSAGSTADAALVHLVDLPDVGAPVVARVAELAGPAVLARAAYASGVPGHPVLLGRDHWAGVQATAAGDRGARDYLHGRAVVEVDCADLAGGADVDRML